jgi:hypothetical protein
LYPDTKTIEEDQREADLMKDKPYTCMLNPLIPAIGIMLSGVTIGYIDHDVWITFFIISVLIAISYFIYVIPRKYAKTVRRRFSSVKRRTNGGYW